MAKRERSGGVEWEIYFVLYHFNFWFVNFFPWNCIYCCEISWLAHGEALDKRWGLPFPSAGSDQKKQFALRAVIGTNLHGEGGRALSKRTAISLWSSFALGWGHLWALMNIWTPPSFYRKRFVLIWCFIPAKRRCTFSVCFGFGFCVCVCFIVWVCVRGVVCFCLGFVCSFVCFFAIGFCCCCCFVGFFFFSMHH